VAGHSPVQVVPDVCMPLFSVLAAPPKPLGMITGRVDNGVCGINASLLPRQWEDGLYGCTRVAAATSGDRAEFCTLQPCGKSASVERVNPYQFKICLRFRHPTADPADITLTLGINPSRSWRVGEPRCTPKGNPLEGTWPDTYWTAILTEGQWPQEGLADTLGGLLDQIAAHKRASSTKSDLKVEELSCLSAGSSTVRAETFLPMTCYPAWWTSRSICRLTSTLPTRVDARREEPNERRR